MKAAGLSLWLLIPAILVGLLVSALYISIAVLNARLFNELLHARDTNTLIWLISGIGFFLILRPLAEVWSQILQNRAGLTIKSRLRQALLAELAHRGPMHAGLGRSGQIQSVMTDGVESIEPYFVKYFTQLAVTALTSCGLTIGIWTISPTIAIVLISCAIAIVAIPRIWDKALAERGQSHWIAYEELNADFVDAMMGMSTLKSFGAAHKHGEKLAQQSNELLSTTMNQLRLSLGETGLSGMMKVLGPALGLIIAITQIQSGTMQITQLFLITMLSMELFRPFTALSACWHEAFFGVSTLPALNALFTERTATEPDRQKIETPSHPTATTKSKYEVPENFEIEFKNVSYTYPESTKSALSTVNFSIPQGKTTAIVGLSGAGKTTAIGLLMGFDAPSDGKVLIGGVSTTEIEVAKSLTLVPQDPIIFPGSVRSILHDANQNATDEEMMQALMLAEADNIQQENHSPSPESLLDLEIYEQASNLSGGQKQRLAIARALIRHCPILVLDESTSALDTQTETKVLNNIRLASPKATLVIVTHRIDTAARTDHVIVLGDGQVQCSGNPEELKLADNAWSLLVSTQLGGSAK